MFATVILVILTVILLTIFLLIGRNAKKYPPGPFGWPFIGNQLLLKRLSRKFGGQHKAFAELSRQYGSNVIAIDVGFEKLLVVSGSKLINSVLKNEDFDGRPWNEFISLRNMGKKQGITMNDGADWRDLRSWMVRTFRIFGFGKREMSDMIKDELIVIVDNLKTGGVRRLKPLISPAVINVIWSLVTGKPFCEGKRLQYFSDLLDRRAQLFDMVGGLISAFPWIRYIAPEFSGYNILVALNNELKAFLMETIDEHRKNYRPGSETDVIDAFLLEMMNNEEDPKTIFTEDQLITMLVDLVIAGCTTTGITLDVIFLSLVVHQDVQRKMQEEIDSVIPRDRLPSLEDKLKLPYVEAILAEAQRLWPVFPIIGPRRVLRETYLDDYRIPKNTTILLNMYSINTDPALFPEPEKFKPERFMKNGAFESDPNVIHFGKGKRRCPGEVLARSALFLLTVGLLQKYTLLPVPGQGPFTVDIKPGLTNSPTPYEVLVIPR